MRMLLPLAGIVLVVASLLVLYRGGIFTSRRDLMNVGGLTVPVEEQNPSLPWAAGLSLIAGIVLIVTGVQRKGAGLRRLPR